MNTHCHKAHTRQRKNAPKRIEYFASAVNKKSLPFDNPNDLAYIRVFDYVMLEWFAYIAAHVNSEMLENELIKIYKTDEFQESLNLHKKFGFEFYTLDDNKCTEMLKLANKLMIASTSKALAYQMPVIPAHVVMASFIYVMSKNTVKVVQSRNICNELFNQIIDRSTPLAHLINDTAREIGFSK